MFLTGWSKNDLLFICAKQLSLIGCQRKGQNMIDVKNVYHDYSNKGHYAVSDITFKMNKGEIFGFLGPSGAGKSTMQNIMTGILKIQKGDVQYDGVSIKEQKKDFFNSIGVSFEHPNVYKTLTGYENLKYYSALYSVDTLDPMMLLDSVGLKEDANKKAGEYSKGMKQRLTFVRSLINNPKYMFLDEPTNGLDPSNSLLVQKIILQQKKRGATIILTTHNMELADRLCDTVAFISEGKVEAIDSPNALKLKYGTKQVKIDYLTDNKEKSTIIPLDEKERISDFLMKNEVLKMHTSEATLEDIFIKVTGKELI